MRALTVLTRRSMPAARAVLAQQAPEAAQELVAATHGDLTLTTIAILWASAILSAIVDNIPFDAAERVGGRFIALTEGRGLPPAELDLLRRAYRVIMED